MLWKSSSVNELVKVFVYTANTCTNGDLGTLKIKGNANQVWHLFCGEKTGFCLWTTLIGTLALLVIMSLEELMLYKYIRVGLVIIWISLEKSNNTEMAGLNF